MILFSICIALILAYYFFKRSKSTFFSQSRETLAEKRHEVFMLLCIIGLFFVPYCAIITQKYNKI